MNPQQKLQQAMTFARSNRPATGGFPFLAACLRAAGVQKNIWTLPAAQSLYILEDGIVVNQATPLIEGMVDLPPFMQEALITALRRDQAGESSFPEFLRAIWEAGVVSYEVDFIGRVLTYRGPGGEEYRESYPEVVVSGLV